MVVIIIATLAAIAMPLLTNRSAEARNAQALALLKQLGEGHRSYIADQTPGIVPDTQYATTLNAYFNTNPVFANCNAGTLVSMRSCGYIPNIAWQNERYQFRICNPDAASTANCCPLGAWASMRGTAETGAQFPATYCAAYNRFGEVVRQ